MCDKPRLQLGYKVVSLTKEPNQYTSAVFLRANADTKVPLYIYNTTSETYRLFGWGPMAVFDSLREATFFANEPLTDYPKKFAVFSCDYLPSVDTYLWDASGARYEQQWLPKGTICADLVRLRTLLR